MATTNAAHAAPALEPQLSVLRKSRTNFDLARQRFFRQRLAVFGLVVVVAFVLCAILAPVIAPTGYAKADLMAANKFPSMEYPFGTDTIGHDMLSRVIFGIRTSLMVAFAAVGLACLIGMPLGMAAGLKGGWLDFIVLRIVEIMTALPGILFAIFLMAIISSGAFDYLFIGGQVTNVIFVIGITSWVPLCRLMRAQILQLREQEYVTAARSIGASEYRVAIDSPPAERDSADDRGDYAWHPGRDLRRGRPEFPRDRHQRTRTESGQDGLGQPPVHSALLASWALPLTGHRAGGAGICLSGGWSAGRTRPAPDIIRGHSASGDQMKGRVLW